MTWRADYTAAEWTLLRNAGEVVGLGMLAVSQSGLVGKLRELTVLSRCLTPGAVPVQFKRNELMLALLEDVRTQPLGPVAYLSRGDVAGLMVTIARAHLHLLAHCEQVAALLAMRAPEGEADGFKRWLVAIARSVAEASGDGWLGCGRRVSQEEASMLDQIAAALHTSPVAPVPTATQLDAMLGLAPQDAGGVSGNGDGHEYHRGSGG